ncbi:MAG: hypothetical protein K5987_03090 [Lachnospiraceae bacterium]|nr:hypothetical protein [Lachnospiraceae bacterium]
MTEVTYDIPIAFMTFNRPDTTEQVFNEIKKIKPAKLYAVSDGPRKDKDGEEEKVSACRRLIEEGIDWECELIKVYAKDNMGCKERMHTGISYVFDREPMAVILEDDVVPSEQFFEYCRELLKLYENDKRVMMISGTNLLKGVGMEGRYTFSCFPSIWGWASWARAWKLYDPEVKDWPKVKKDGSLKKVQGGFSYLFLKEHIDSVYEHRKDTWDIQWDFCRHIHKGLGIVPSVNLIKNIGFDREDATHTKGSHNEDFSYGEMIFPLEKKEIKRDTAYDAAYIKKYYGLSKTVQAVLRKLKIIK